MRDRLRFLDWENIRADVRLFFEPGYALGLINRAVLYQKLNDDGSVSALGRK
jgi:hypothetical protein